MGFFSGPPRGSQLYFPSSDIRSHPDVGRKHHDREKSPQRHQNDAKTYSEDQGPNTSHHHKIDAGEQPGNNKADAGSKKVENPDTQKETHDSQKEAHNSQTDKPNADDTSSTSEGGGTGEEIEKKPRERKVIKVRNRERFDPETSKNTHYNSLLYHTSNESVDMYARENDSSDLLGRLYYDDYDSDSVRSPLVSGDSTPLLSPSLNAGGTGGDYFSSRPIHSPGILTPISRSGTSHSNLKSPDSLAAIDEKLRKHQQNQLQVPSSSLSNHHVPTPEKSKYSKGISFDTSTADTERKSLTLKSKHPKFKFRRNNKTFLTGFNDDQESLRAIKWLFDEAIVNGDTIVVLQVLDEKIHHQINRDKCQKSLEVIENLNIHNKKISIVYEVVIGKPQKYLKRAIDEYTPQMMAIGTHQSDKEQHKSFFAKTTLSKYFLEYALVPVVVVKPRYNHVEELPTPIDSSDYFKNWLSGIDISDTYGKDKEKKIKKFRSPLGSRSSSSVSINTLNEDRGREKHGNNPDNHKFKASSSTLGSRSDSKNRDDKSRDANKSPHKRTAFSKLFHH